MLASSTVMRISTIRRLSILQCSIQSSTISHKPCQFRKKRDTAAEVICELSLWKYFKLCRIWQIKCQKGLWEHAKCVACGDAACRFLENRSYKQLDTWRALPCFLRNTAAEAAYKHRWHAVWFTGKNTSKSELVRNTGKIHLDVFMYK